MVIDCVYVKRHKLSKENHDVFSKFPFVIQNYWCSIDKNYVSLDNVKKFVFINKILTNQIQEILTLSTLIFFATNLLILIANMT